MRSGKNGENGKTLSAVVIFLLLAPCAAGPASGAETAAPAPNRWALVDAEHSGSRGEHFLFYSPWLKKAVLIGGRLASKTPFVQTFDPGTRSWAAFSDARPKLGRRQAISSQSAGAINAEGKRCYFLVGKRLHAFDLESKTWADLGESPLLETLQAPQMACDPLHGELLVAGSATETASLGWMNVLAYNVQQKKWRKLAFGDEAARKAHAERVAALDALAVLIGRTRHAWYRDPQQQGTEAERKDLTERCAALKKRPGLNKEGRSGLDGVAGKIAAKKLLEALHAARALKRKLEDAAEAQAPVPPARRNSALVRDPVHKVLVLFGGDHEDYMMNDTWLFDLEKRAWRRARPKIAPSPRAGHALVYLPKSGKIALWDGYRHGSRRFYSAFEAAYLPRREVWLYDVGAERWDLVAGWPLPPPRRSSKTPAPKGPPLPVRAGVWALGFFGYSFQYAMPACVAGAGDRLIFSGRGPRKNSKGKYFNGTWMLPLDPAKLDASGAKKYGAVPSTRSTRQAEFTAAFCEDPAPAKPLELDKLPPNTWTVLPRPPKVPYNGRRRRPYGTAAWDSDHDELLHWGGGHKAMSSSDVTHWSPASNRMAEGYDPDECYAINGFGGRSLLGRPWVQTHAYGTYRYDTRNKLLVLLHRDGTYRYDPLRMDWLPDIIPQPFSGHCYTARLGSTPHGAVAWAGSLKGYMGGQQRGLWLLRDEKGWKELLPLGKMPRTGVDRSGFCYDAKRDRLLFLPGVDNKKLGIFTSYAFKDGRVEQITPANLEYGKTTSCQEMVYVAHCDWVLLLYTITKDGKAYNPVYDCARNRWLLLDTGPRAATTSAIGSGMAYDAKRKLVYVISERGALFALRVDPKSAKRIKAP